MPANINHVSNKPPPAEEVPQSSSPPQWTDIVTRRGKGKSSKAAEPVEAWSGAVGAVSAVGKGPVPGLPPTPPLDTDSPHTLSPATKMAAKKGAKKGKAAPKEAEVSLPEQTPSHRNEDLLRPDTTLSPATKMAAKKGAKKGKGEPFEAPNAGENAEVRRNTRLRQLERDFSGRALELSWRGGSFIIRGADTTVQREHLRDALELLTLQNDLDRESYTDSSGTKPWGTWKYCAELDFSRSSQFSDDSLHILVDWLEKHKICVRVLKFFRCGLADDGCFWLADYLETKNCAEWPCSEIHLSDNRIGVRGVRELFEFLASPTAGRCWPIRENRKTFLPLWLRLENNVINNPRAELAQARERFDGGGATSEVITPRPITPTID